MEEKRRKLDYMTATMDINDYKGVALWMDENGISKFNKRDVEMYLGYEDRMEYLMQKYADSIGFETRYFINNFEKINGYFVKNKLYPPFPEPKKVFDNLRTREEILKEYPESELNKFFGVENYWDYKPPVYNPPEGPQKENS